MKIEMPNGLYDVNNSAEEVLQKLEENAGSKELIEFDCARTGFKAYLRADVITGIAFVNLHGPMVSRTALQDCRLRRNWPPTRS